MNQYAILNAIGQDRPGLVDEVSRFILEAGCNVEDSRMAILGGDFAMLILLRGPGEAVERVLREAEDEGQTIGLRIRVHRSEAAAPGRREGLLPYEIHAYSLDHPGIVQRVAHYLAEHKINIRGLDTRVHNAPHSGQPLFSLHATVDVPAGERVAELRRGLAAIGAEEDIDFELKPVG